MAEVVLFHHAQGLTPGLRAFADELREAGHVVHTPDLYEGRTFTTLEEGIGHAKEIGMEQVTKRGLAAVAGLHSALVYIGISLGVVLAQQLAQTRDGARAALLVAACLPRSEFGSSWPATVALQIHAMEADPEFDNGWDLPAARALVAEVDDAELFLYPGAEHLFVDPTAGAYAADAAALFRRRVLTFLDGR